MKKVLSILLLSTFLFSLFAEGIKVECNDKWESHEHKNYEYFELCYIEDFESSEYVTWKMTRNMALAPNLPRSNDFRVDFGISTGSADPNDYLKTGYDRGHLAPNDDFNYSFESMSATFLMSNMSPQTPKCNRQTWRCAEKLDSEYAKEYGIIYICCGPIFNNGEIKATIGKNEVGIPDAFFRIFYCENQLLKCYIIPQDCEVIAPGSKDNISKLENKLKRYEVDLEQIEESTGLKFIFE